MLFVLPCEPSAPEPGPLIQLCHHRWAIPVMALLHLRVGARFVELYRGLEAPPAAIQAALDRLVTLGWVTPNPGYGHPLRPEWILTPTGSSFASVCSRLHAALGDWADLLLRKWSLPILATLSAGARRYAEIRRRLPEATDRALSQALQTLQEQRLVRRVVGEGRPPTVTYHAEADGLTLGRLAAELLDE